MLISIILPVYNMETFLNDCIESVLNQTFKEIELIIVDDGSSDNSYNICSKYEENDDRVILLRQENKGPGSARNLGLKYANGEYIAFLDSDDIMDSDYLANMIFHATKNNYDVIQSNFNVFSDEGTKIRQKNKISREITGNKNIIDMYLRKKYIDNYLWNKMFKKESILDKNITFKNLFYSEDQVFLLEVLDGCHSMGCLDLYGYNHRVHKASLCQQKFNNKKMDVFKAIEFMKEFCISRNYNTEFFSIDLCTYASRFYAYNYKGNNQALCVELMNIFKINYPVFKLIEVEYVSSRKRILLQLFNNFPVLASYFINKLNL